MMKPTSVHTVIVGDSIPMIVRLTIEHNKEVLINAGIDYSIHQVPRDRKNYPCAGFQAEVLKLSLMGAMSNIVVADWDIWLESIPDLPASKHVFFGFRRADGPDFFICYCNDLMMKPLFTELLKKEKKYRGDSPGFTKIFADRLMNQGLVREYPYNTYCHFSTGIGLMNCQNTFANLNGDYQIRVEKRALNNLVSWFRSERGVL